MGVEELAAALGWTHSWRGAGRSNAGVTKTCFGFSKAAAVTQHVTGAHMAYSMGCLTDMSKNYLKGRPTNWTHNVGILDIFNNGNFNLIVLEIIKGVTTYNGKIISA